MPGLSWWELSSQVDIKAAVLSKLWAVAQSFELGGMCYNKAFLFPSFPTSKIKFFLFLQHQAAWSILHYFHLHHTKLNLQREVMLGKSQFSQLKNWKGDSVVFSCRSSLTWCTAQSKWCSGFQRKTERQEKEVFFRCLNSQRSHWKYFPSCWKVLLRWTFPPLKYESLFMELKFLVYFCVPPTKLHVHTACVSYSQRHSVFWMETVIWGENGSAFKFKISPSLLLLSLFYLPYCLSLIELQVDGQEEKASITIMNVFEKHYCYEPTVDGRSPWAEDSLFIYSAWYSSVLGKTDYSWGPLCSCLSPWQGWQPTHDKLPLA